MPKVHIRGRESLPQHGRSAAPARLLPRSPIPPPPTTEVSRSCRGSFTLCALLLSCALAYYSFFAGGSYGGTAHALGGQGAAAAAADVVGLPVAGAAAASGAAHAAALASAQCGFAEPVSAAMPVGTVISDAPLPPHGHPSCADVEGALARAVRGGSGGGPRAWGDGRSDGALALPAPCSLRWLSPAQACGVLPGLLILMGDSLSRHLAFSLSQVLSGNYAAGPLLGFQPPHDDPANGLFFPEDCHALCHCDETYRICAHVRPPPTARHFSALCPAWGEHRDAPAPLRFLPWYGGFFNGTAVDALLSANFTGAGGARWEAGAPPRVRRPVLVAEVGPGWADDFEAGNGKVEAFIDSVFAAAARAPRGGARVVCYLIPAPVDALKPAQFVGKQGLAPTRALGEWVAGLCRQRGGRVLDALPISLGAYTRDGTHYATRVMTLIAQSLLNLLLAPWPDEGGGSG